ncbi:MAG: hypothetical protein MZV70_69285 [Desulfobacterales bacterium]|nr:hypothetical protein [Desulfobacterales bacterium]
MSRRSTGAGSTSGRSAGRGRARAGSPRPYPSIGRPQGELAVVDARRRILFFDAAGKHLRDLPAVDLSFYDIRPDAKGNYYGYFVSVFDENPRHELRKLDGALKTLFPIESSPTQDTARDGFDPFFPVLRWAVLPGGGVVCGHA